MIWLWYGLAALGVVALLSGGAFFVFYWFIKRRFLDVLVRILQEKPLFIIPRGQPIPDAEEVNITSRDGLKLRGLYLKTTTARRRGVVAFGLEYGSNRWACVPYCDFLRQNGYDVFTFESRGQGDSEPQPGYEPLQWVTTFEVNDFQDAFAYLKGRPDADPEGVGFFGISKGGSAGLLAAARDPYVRCFVTDGIFATHTTMVPYMRKWIQIYSTRTRLQRILPLFVYKMIASTGMRKTEQVRGCRFPHLEQIMRKLAPRPLLMIHGEADTYIKPDMARALFDRARQPKELWMVAKARHNQAFQLATSEYQQRVLQFFDKHLAREPKTPEAPSAPALPAPKFDRLQCRTHLASAPLTTQV